MTPDEFRAIALGLPEVVESAHMGHPDFRVARKIFATLGAPDEDWAMVKLTPTEQRRLVREEPEVFRAVKGAWGRQGCTNVLLPTARKETVTEALVLAWRGRAPKKLAARLDGP
jgi:hypothetical protein